ncbi:MAG: UvrD-helicase domain-containing protein [Clostridia bacterium]|nr:UvrD-helicase domain-containing protein [Clostridia bacterium]
MKFVLFEKSAVELLATKAECQSTDYSVGKNLIDTILCLNDDKNYLSGLCIETDTHGLYFIGKEKSSKILVIDLTYCNLLKVEKDHPENIIVVLQKMFRAALHFWNRQPFTNAERVNNSKLVIFPFPYNYNRRAANKRLVLEREPKSKRLVKRGIDSPLLAYKYNDESMPYGSEEVANVNVLDDAGEAYLRIRNIVDFSDSTTDIQIHDASSTPFVEVSTGKSVWNEGFRYLEFELQYKKLTERQKSVVDFENVNVPLRIVGSAGTGKTTSMLLRAYRLLKDAQGANKRFNIAFFAHSESTRYELEESFKILDNENEFTSLKNPQNIEFITLFSFCKRFRNIKDIQVSDDDASDAKEYQLMLIEDIFNKVHQNHYKQYKQYLSSELRSLFDNTDSYIIASMLQHEFSVQIKGRADGNIESYKKIESLKNGLPVNNGLEFKDKDYVYKIYQAYQELLEMQSVYDIDDIVIEALLGLNAPIWRRERAIKGYDYLFVDEMHLFNLNEQHVFHYLTRNINQEKIPICFALDYSQAIGDRGDHSDSYIEKELSNDGKYEYNTVMRSSSYIVDLCASIIASGALIFQSSFKNPYLNTPQNCFSIKDEAKAKTPKLVMVKNEEAMLEQLKNECDTIIRELTCKNHRIAIISFDDKYVSLEFVEKLKQILSREVFLLNGRNVAGLNSEVKAKDKVIFTSPYNINGLEFDAVILLGVDGKRVPPTDGVADIAKNYLKYRAYNMLYLSCSRAKYRIVLLGNEQNGDSECLNYSINAETLYKENID